MESRAFTDKLSKETLINAMSRRGADELHSLTAVSNNAGAAGKGGLSTLSQNGQLNRLILSFLGNNKALEKKYLSGKIAIELCPQGTLAERLRAGGAGIPAFFTPTGVRKYSSCFSRSSRFLSLTVAKTHIYKRERFPSVWMSLGEFWSRASRVKLESLTARRT